MKFTDTEIVANGKSIKINNKPLMDEEHFFNDGNSFIHLFEFIDLGLI